MDVILSKLSGLFWDTAQKPDPILIQQIFSQIAKIGSIKRI
jgi:hypothetical protein